MQQIVSKLIPSHSILFLFFIFCFFYPQLVNAHPPESVQLEYDSSSQTLKVMITHDTSSPDKHFVQSVVIVRSGIIVSTANYNSQPEKSSFTYSYDDLPAQDGDTFDVTVSCSISGNKTGTLSIKKE
jgi:hypothetical protein